MRPTLVSRVFRPYLVLVSLGLVAIISVASIALVRHDTAQAVDRVSIAARLAASMIGTSSVPEWEQGIADVVLNAAGESMSLALVHDSADRIVAYGDPLRLVQRLLGHLDDAATGTGAARLSNAGRVAYAIVPVVSPSRTGTQAPALVVAVLPVRSLDTNTTGVLLFLIAIVVLIVGAVGILLHSTLRWIQRPLRWIEETAQGYARGDLDAQPVPDGPQELVDITRSLNAMAGELDHRLSAISDQRNQLEAILSSMVEGVVVLGQDRQIISINAAAARLMNVSANEASGRTLIDSLRNAQLDELADTARATDEPVERTVTLYRDHPLHLQVHASALRSGPDAQPSGTLIVMNDITRLKHLEDLRKDFVANVSHELKTPITSIKGFVETLLDGAVDDPEHARRFLQIILNHSDRLHAIIEDLLSLSRLEQGDQRITFYEFPLRSLVTSAIDLCAPRAEEKSITIEPEIRGNEMAWGNPNLLEQALVNLIDNAVKYSPDGSRVEIDATSEAEMLTIRIADHGQGIRARDLPRIFERFYRTDKARSRELGGTGLGLAIVKHIARAHLGEVSVQSLLGEGSTFTIEIPQWRSYGDDPKAGQTELGEWDAMG